MKEKDNDILAAAKNAYTEEYIAMLGTKISCFQSLISKETNNLVIYMVDTLKTRYKILVSKVASNTDKEIKTYISDAYAYHMKLKNNNHRTDKTHRDGKYLVRK